MADKKISELTELTTPDGTEELVVNDSGVSKKVQIDNLITGIDDNATSTQLTVSDISVDVTGYVTCDNKTVIEGVDTGNPINTVTDSLRVSGYGIQANRGAMFLTNAATDGLIHMGNSGAHNSNILASFTSNGLTFNGDTAAANALDDYETGTFTMSGSPIYTTTCKYIKIGELVTLHGTIKVATGTEKGPWTLSYIPFVCGSYDGAGSIIGATDQSEVGSIRIANGSKDLQYTINQTSVNFDYLSFSITYSTN